MKRDINQMNERLAAIDAEMAEVETEATELEALAGADERDAEAEKVNTDRFEALSAEFDELADRDDVDSVAMPATSLDPSNDATIFYTSGSTGHPKGVVSCHRNIITTAVRTSSRWS